MRRTFPLQLSAETWRAILGGVYQLIFWSTKRKINIRVFCPTLMHIHICYLIAPQTRVNIPTAELHLPMSVVNTFFSYFDWRINRKNVISGYIRLSRLSDCYTRSCLQVNLLLAL